MTRRFLLLFLLAAVSVALLKRNIIRHLFTGPQRKEGPRLAVSSDAQRSTVGIVKGDNPEFMVREAVRLVGGLDQFSLQGRSVLVKPNVVSYKANPSTTNPRVVAAVVKILYEEGAGKVYVGDMSAAIRLRTLENMTRTGIREAAEREGAEVLAFEDHKWVEVPLTGARYVERALVTEWIYKVDIVINLPVIKTHRSASYSICLKNFIGCTHIRQRPYFIDSDHWEELVAEFNLAYTPDLNIADGTTSMIEGGPWEGTGMDTGVVIAGSDRVAVDIVGLGLIRGAGQWRMVTDKAVWEQRQIKRALELGIGKGPESIDLVASGSGSDFEDLIGSIEEHTGLVVRSSASS